MSPIEYDTPQMIKDAVEATMAHVTGVNIRAPEGDGGEEKITIYWELWCAGGNCVKKGAHTIDGAEWGDRHPNDSNTPATSATYREHVRFLAYKTLMVDGVIPEAPIT